MYQQIDVENRVDGDDSEEIFIVLSADAIIEKFAVMVEIGRTAVAAIAVMTVNVHILVANHTIAQFLNSVAIAKLLVQHQRIDRVGDCQVNVVVADYYHQQVVETQQDPESSVVDIVQGRNDEDRVEDDLDDKQNQREDLLDGEGGGVGVGLLVGACLFGTGLEFLFAAVIDAHSRLR